MFSIQGIKKPQSLYIKGFEVFYCAGGETRTLTPRGTRS